MTDTALNDRLRQKSRRSGLAIGLSMLLTIALLVAAATAIYAALVPILQDVIPIPAARSAPAAGNPGVAPRPVAQQSGQAQIAANPPPAQPADAILQGAVPTPEPEPQPTPEPVPTEEPFAPTHQVGAQRAVNLRPKPSSENTADNQPIRALSPASPLQYLDEDQPTDNPNDAPRWMRFRTGEGEEGWIRELDTVPFQP